MQTISVGTVTCKGRRGVKFIPAHAEASADIKELVCYNRDKVHEVAKR